MNQIFALYFFVGQLANAANVLFMPMHFENSHKKSMAPTAEALGKRGHYVVIWSPVAKKSLITNEFFVDAELEVDLDDRFLLDAMKYENDTNWHRMLWNMREVT